jgi:hypothetical protein
VVVRRWKHDFAKSQSCPRSDAEKIGIHAEQQKNRWCDACQAKQSKTKVKLRIEIVGELKDLIDRIAARKTAHNPRGIAVIVDEAGVQLTLGRLQDHFALARTAAGVKPDDFQFRDLRAKAASDKADVAGLEEAQGQLGDASVTMTEHCVRNRKGKKVAPTR